MNFGGGSGTTKKKIKGSEQVSETEAKKESMRLVRCTFDDTCHNVVTGLAHSHLEGSQQRSQDREGDDSRQVTFWL